MAKEPWEDQGSCIRSRSKPAADSSAAPVESPDQLRTDGLHERLAVHNAAGWRTVLGGQKIPAAAIVLREPILGPPEQTRKPAQVVLVAAAQEPARIGARRNIQKP